MTYYRTATSQDQIGPYDVVVKTRPPVTIEEGLIGTRIQFGVATSAPDSLMAGHGAAAQWNARGRVSHGVLHITSSP